MERQDGDCLVKWLLALHDDSVETTMVDIVPPTESCEDLLRGIEMKLASACQDAHNVGFYINEYTTKINALGGKPLGALQRACVKVLEQEASPREAQGMSRERGHSVRHANSWCHEEDESSGHPAGEAPCGFGE